MKHLSKSLLAKTVRDSRKTAHLSQQELADKVHMHRTMIGRIEKKDYVPTINQLERLGEVLNFEPSSFFVEEASTKSTPSLCMQGSPDLTVSVTDSSIPEENVSDAFDVRTGNPYKIAVAGTGYVGLSLAVLLSQHNHVTAVDIIPEKVEKLNSFVSPIQDTYIEKYLSEAKEGLRKLDLYATTDGAAAYAESDFVVVAAPTNYDPKTNFFDCYQGQREEAGYHH